MVVLVVSAVLGFSVLAGATYRTLMRLRVNGPVYSRIVDGKDFVAVVLPPSIYIVEAYLSAHQMAEVENATALDAQVSRLQLLRAEFEAETERWSFRLTDATIRRALLEDVRDPARRFFTMAEESLIPLCRAGELDRASAYVEGPMRSAFELHRSAIDGVVAAARASYRDTEKAAADELSSGRRMTFLFGAAAAATLVCLLAAVVAWSLARGRARAESRAREMTADLAEVKSTLDRTHDRIYMFDADSLRCLYANQAGLSRLGPSGPDLGRLSLADVLPEIAGGAFALMAGPLLAGEQESVSFETTLGGCDGPDGLVEATLQLVKLEDHRGRFVIVARDIGERRRHEQFRRRQARVLEMVAADAPLRATLSQLCESIEAQQPGALASVLLLEGDQLRCAAGPSLHPEYVTAIDGVVIGPNVGSCGAAAATGERVIVENTQTDPKWAPFAELARRFGLLACWSQPVKAVDGEVLGAFAVYHRSPRRPSPDEVRLLEEAAHVAAIAIERQRTSDRLARSIGALRRANEQSEQRALEMERLRDRAEAANVAKSQFVANMSHEIRTPLTAIIGFAELLADSAGDPEESGRAIDTIGRAATHLLAVVNDVLDLSRIESGMMTCESVRTELPRVVREVGSFLSPRAREKGVQLKLSAGSVLPVHIRSDPTRLRQILMNLAGNALKFTDSGTVSITVREEWAEDQSRLVVDVEDTGVGMTEAQAGVLFEAFSQADASITRRYGGTGLGLMISRHLARLLGGDVELVRTSPGRGSCFRFSMPLTAEPGSAAFDHFEAIVCVENAGPDPRVVFTGRVLLVEDGLDNQRLIAHHLRRAGAEVDIAGHGAEAIGLIEAAARAGRPYGLILTDMQMPVMDGYTLARTLRKAGCTTAIVAITAHAMPEDRERCVTAGCDDFLTKPIDRRTLIALCSEWLNVPSRGGLRARAA